MMFLSCTTKHTHNGLATATVAPSILPQAGAPTPTPPRRAASDRPHGG
jgi:hypothetical protein